MKWRAKTNSRADQSEVSSSDHRRQAGANILTLKKVRNGSASAAAAAAKLFAVDERKGNHFISLELLGREKIQDQNLFLFKDVLYISLCYSRFYCLTISSTNIFYNYFLNPHLTPI